MSQRTKLVVAIADELLRHKFKFLALDTGLAYVVITEEQGALDRIRQYGATHLVTDLEWGRAIVPHCTELVVMGVALCNADREEFTIMGVTKVVDSKVEYMDFSDWFVADTQRTSVFDDRRRSKRMTAKGWVIDGRGQAARLIDLSREGAKVEFVGLDDFELDLDRCTVMPMLGVKTEVGARPMWQRRTEKPGGLEVGLAFDSALRFYN